VFDVVSSNPASSRSSFFRLSPIKRTFEACATMTSCPNSFSNRLTHGECVPVSSATRLCGIARTPLAEPFGGVLSLCSSTTSPRSSNTQYQLQRSPRSNPTVYFFSARSLVCRRATVILFLIAGPLCIAPRARYHWELIASRRKTGILIPSDFGTYGLAFPAHPRWLDTATALKVERSEVRYYPFPPRIGADFAEGGGDFRT
jgi:hypothetical protein